MRAVVFVPGRLVCAVTFQEQAVKNAIPHVTVLLKGRTSARQSNEVLERVFSDADMRERYRQMERRERIVERVRVKEVELGEGIGRRAVVIVFLEEELVLDGVKCSFDSTGRSK